MISPAIEAGWLDILLREQRGDLRPMINGVVEGLDQHDDDRSVIVLGQMEDLAQVPLLRDGDQLISRPLCSSSQFVEARKSGEFLWSWL